MTEAVTTAEIRSLVKALSKTGATPDEIVTSGMVNLSLSDVYEILGLPQPKPEMPDAVKTDRVTKPRQKTRKASSKAPPIIPWNEEREQWLRDAFNADYTVGEMASALKLKQTEVRQKIKELNLKKIKAPTLPKIKNDTKTNTKPSPSKGVDTGESYDVNRFAGKIRRPEENIHVEKAKRWHDRVRDTARSSRFVEDHVRHGGLYATSKLVGRGALGVIKSKPSREIVANLLNQHLGIVGNHIATQTGVYGNKTPISSKASPSQDINKIQSTTVHSFSALTSQLQTTTNKIVGALEDTIEIIHGMNLGNKMSMNGEGDIDRGAISGEAGASSGHAIKSRLGMLVGGGAAALMAYEFMSNMTTPAEAAVDPATTDTSGATTDQNEVEEDDDSPGENLPDNPTTPAPGPTPTTPQQDQKNIIQKNDPSNDDTNNINPELKFKADDIEFKADRIKFEGLDGGPPAFDIADGSSAPGGNGGGSSPDAAPETPPSAAPPSAAPADSGSSPPSDTPPPPKASPGGTTEKAPATPDDRATRAKASDIPGAPAPEDRATRSKASDMPGAPAPEDMATRAKASDAPPPAAAPAPTSPLLNTHPDGGGGNSLTDLYKNGLAQQAPASGGGAPASPPPSDTPPPPPAPNDSVTGRSMLQQRRGGAIAAKVGAEQQRVKDQIDRDQKAMGVNPSPASAPDSTPAPSPPTTPPPPSPAPDPSPPPAPPSPAPDPSPPPAPPPAPGPSPSPPPPDPATVAHGPFGSLRGSAPPPSSDDDGKPDANAPEVASSPDGSKNGTWVSPYATGDDYDPANPGPGMAKITTLDLAPGQMIPPNVMTGQTLNDLSRQTIINQMTPPPTPVAPTSTSDSGAKTKDDMKTHDPDDRPPIPDTHHHGDHMSMNIPGLSYHTDNIGIGA